MDDFNKGFVLGTIASICSIERNYSIGDKEDLIREIIGGSDLSLTEVKQVKDSLFAEDFEIVSSYLE